VNSYNTTVVAPPLVGGYGMGYGMPFFGGGFGYGYGMPIPFMGGLLQIMFLLVIVNVVFGIVKVGLAWKTGMCMRGAVQAVLTSKELTDTAIQCTHATTQQGAINAANGGSKKSGDDDWDKL